ncbi:hypothetical protein BDV93DRAFT_509235 [Ceratobasidium sp. AG-I]|nr:hypothetical protein BDV93DRAFT_509235 [Ceratobasidium sp. AG-I]
MALVKSKPDFCVYHILHASIAVKEELRANGIHLEESEASKHSIKYHASAAEYTWAPAWITTVMELSLAVFIMILAICPCLLIPNADSVLAPFRMADEKGLKGWTTAKEKEMNIREKKRREKIRKRLKALGWTNEGVEFSARQARPWNSLAEISSPLTDDRCVNYDTRLCYSSETILPIDTSYTSMSFDPKYGLCSHSILFKPKKYPTSSKRRICLHSFRIERMGDEKGLKGWTTAKEKEMNIREKKRQEKIRKRLKALGWTNEGMEFSARQARPWNSLAEVSNPLTDDISKFVLPQLIPLLEANHGLHMTQATETRRLACVERVNELSTKLKLDTDPFQVIRDALRPSTPTSSDLTCKGGSAGTGSELRCCFPRIATMPKWECLKHWEMQEISLEGLDELLWERWGEVERSVLDWREVAETQLVGIFEVDKEDETLGTEGQDPRGGVVVKVADPLVYHPSLVNPLLSKRNKADRTAETNLSLYCRYNSAERTPIILLKELEISNIALAELWIIILLKLGIGRVEKLLEGNMPHVIPSSIRMCATLHRRPSRSHSYHDWLRYYTGRVQRAGIDKLRRHMRDVHEVTEPAEGLHYVKKERVNKPEDEWHKACDAHHDTYLARSVPAQVPMREIPFASV